MTWHMGKLILHCNGGLARNLWHALIPQKQAGIGAGCPEGRKLAAWNLLPNLQRSLGRNYPGWGPQLQCPPTTGKNPTDEYLEGMMNEAPGPINFTMFLTMFGEKLNGTDPEDVIRNAFACFDEEASGQWTQETWTG